MESMTGYACLEKNTDQFTFSLEVKSLNSKYLETHLNLPHLLKSYESDIEKILKDRFKRGKIELSINLYDWVQNRNVHINREVLKNYYKEISKAGKELKIGSHVAIESLLMLDGVLQKEKSSITEKSREIIFKTLEKSIDKNIIMRRKEGKSIKRDIEKSLATIAKSIKMIESLSKDVSRNAYGKLKNTIESLTGVKADDTRMYMEIAILADKCDINEEIVRLKDHLQKFLDIFRDNDQIGKKLDFLAQELFREINTIASKSNNSSISHLVVDIKNHIDKIREQCRNII